MTVVALQGTTLTADGDTVGQVTSFSGFDGEAAVEDITTFASTAKEKRVGIPDYGNFTFDVIFDYDDTGQNTLHTNYAAQSLTTFVLTFPDVVVNNKWTFSGYVQSFSVSGTPDESARGSVNILITGAPVPSDSTP